MNELEAVQALRADVPWPGTQELTAPRGRLLEAIDTAAARPRRRLGWVPLVAAAAAAALVAGIVARPRTVHVRPMPAVPARDMSLAAQVLRAAALHVATEPATRPSPDQWIYSKSVEQEPGSPVATNENWIQFDGVDTAYFQGGKLIVHAGPPAAPPTGASAPLRAFDADPTPMTAYDALSSLPPDRTALLAAVDAEIAADPGAVAPAGGSPSAGRTRPQLEFEYLSNLVWNAAQAAPASAEAAVFRAMATIAGVSAQSGVSDAAGRPAIALSDDGDQQQLLFDPHTYEVIGLRQVSDGHYPAPGKSGTEPAGTIVDSVAFVSVTPVNAPGDR
jgi:hypothetical protein